MEIKQITVTAGRTFNHPFEQYSNLRPELTITATLAPGEDLDHATRTLQARAEKLMEQHKENLLETISLVEQEKSRRAEVERIRRQINQTRADLENAQQGKTQLAREEASYFSKELERLQEHLTKLDGQPAQIGGES